MRLIDQQQIQNEHSEATERLRESLQNAIQQAKAPTHEELSELESTSMQSGTGELGPQNPTE